MTRDADAWAPLRALRTAEDTSDCATFSLSGTGALTTLASFDGANGNFPEAGLIADASGTLYGTTEQGGASNFGTVFHITDTGFDVGAAAVPEPQSWAMLIVDFGLIGGSARRRRVTVAQGDLA